jgi:hypothetical protein
VPDDGVTGQGDAGDESEQVPAATESSADEEPAGGDFASAAPSSGEPLVPEKPQDSEPTRDSPAAGEDPDSAPDTRKPLKTGAEVIAEFQLSLHTAMHDERNREARPPDDEHVAFRSVTLAEVYIGPEIDRLSTALQETEWINEDEPFADEIAKARRVDSPYNSEFLLLPGPVSHPMLQRYGKPSHFPEGILRVVGQLYVLGPSMAALVLTFALAESESTGLDKALRDEATAELRHTGSQVGVVTVYQIKYERVQAVLDQVGGRCLDWLQDWAPGTLGNGSGLGVPLCSLISLARGRPFQAQGEYMRLLDLASAVNASRFARPDYLFLMPRRSRRRYREFVAAFNEGEASASHLDLSVAPDIAHIALFSFMVVLGLEGILSLFESRMRATRSDLASFDITQVVQPPPFWDKVRLWLHLKSPAESPVVGLRNRLLALSRDIAVVSGDIRGVLNDNTLMSLWADYPLLQPADPSQPPPPAGNPADAPRKRIPEFIANLKAQETELRELVLVTGQVVSEGQDKRTQTSLNRLTIWLVIFTVALVIMTGFTIWKTFYDSSDSTPKPSPSVSATAKPATRPTPTPTTLKKAAHR